MGLDSISPKAGRVVGQGAGSQATDCEIARYQPELKDQVLELQTHLWSRSVELNAAYFEWKYERNPYVALPLIYLAIQNGRVVGMRGFFGIHLEGGEPLQRRTGLYADDTVIAPEFVNRGLMPRIMSTAFEDLAKQGYEYVFNLSAGPVTFMSSLVMGWRSAGSLRPMRRRTWKAAARTGLRRMIVRGFGRITQIPTPEHDARSFAEVNQTRLRRCYPCISIEHVPRSLAMAELVERIGSDGRLRHVRDQRYFEWRFRNPMRRYRFFFWDKSQMEGYLVLQINLPDSYGTWVANIVDCEASNPGILTELVDAAVDSEKSRSVVIWSATLTPQIVALLEKKGFTNEERLSGIGKQLPALLVRPTSLGKKQEEWSFAGRRLLDLANWDLRMLYSMHG